MFLVWCLSLQKQLEKPLQGSREVAWEKSISTPNFFEIRLLVLGVGHSAQQNYFLPTNITAQIDILKRQFHLDITASWFS